MILIKENFIKDKMLIEVRGEYYRGRGDKCKNPQGYTMEINYLSTIKVCEVFCMNFYANSDHPCS